MLAVVFIQPAFRDFPGFIQRSEQVKIQNFCPARPVEPFDKRILRRLTRLDKFQCHAMLFSQLRKCQRGQFPAVVHAQQLEHRFIAPGIGLVNIDRPAQQ